MVVQVTGVLFWTGVGKLGNWQLGAKPVVGSKTSTGHKPHVPEDTMTRCTDPLPWSKWTTSARDVHSQGGQNIGQERHMPPMDPVLATSHRTDQDHRPTTKPGA
eukprot:7414800-Karenia_brevis.AAC.1